MRVGVAEQLPKQSFYRVPLALYRPGDILEDDVYFLYQGQYVLYKMKDLSWKEEDRVQLQDFKIFDLYIKLPDARAHHEVIEKNLSRILESPIVATREKAQLLYDTSSTIVEDLYQKPMASENLKRSVKSVHRSIEFLSQQSDNFFAVMSMATRNYTEFNHAWHTAIYAIAVGRKMGIKTFNQISELGIGALLHDIGKTKVDPRIISQEGRLSGEDRKAVELHPRFGFDILRASRAVPELSEQIVLQHHERENASGYPSKLSMEIHPFAKIVAVVDCFDALTTDRSFQAAMTPLQAIKVMQSDLKDEYDQNVLVNLVKVLTK
jgi:HD-GYP domain-containing protein (c-di-GMP phosphodiesterase class II)